MILASASAPVNNSFSDALRTAAFGPDSDDVFIAEPLEWDPSDVPGCLEHVFGPELAPDQIADAWTPDDDEPTGPDAADRQWAAEHLNDDGRDFDAEADDALAIDAHERGLIFA
jgi:hypothetical protein